MFAAGVRLPLSRGGSQLGAVLARCCVVWGAWVSALEASSLTYTHESTPSIVRGAETGPGPAGSVRGQGSARPRALLRCELGPCAVSKEGGGEGASVG